MTTARNPDERALVDTTEYNRLIAAELRAVMSRKKIKQTTVAREVFGHEKPQWLQSRVSGNVPFTPGDLLAIVDYLGEDIVPILRAAKHGPSPSPIGGVQTTAEYIAPLLSLVRGESVETTSPTGVLELVS